jgi:nitrogen fixation protein NifX
MKVAFSSSTGTCVDENFGSVASFSIWDIGPREAVYVTSLEMKDPPQGKEARLVALASILTDCAIVCSRAISGPAAAKLIARNVYPLPTREVTPVEEIIGRLQAVLEGSPPPWMRKAQTRELADRFNRYGKP